MIDEFVKGFIESKTDSDKKAPINADIAEVAHDHEEDTPEEANEEKKEEPKEDKKE